MHASYKTNETKQRHSFDRLGLTLPYRTAILHLIHKDYSLTINMKIIQTKLSKKEK